MGEFYGNQHTGATDDGDYADLREAVLAYAAENGEAPTTEEAANDDRFPSLNTIYKRLDRGWNDLLEDVGLERGQPEAYGPEETAEMLQDLRAVQQAVESDHLTSRQYAERGAYGDDTIKERFGSWREACERADVDAGKRYGVSCEGPQGATLDSRLELAVATALHERDVVYEVHPEVPETNWTSDLYLPEVDLWVEVNGFAAGERPNEADFERKLDHYEREGLDCVVVEGAKELVTEIRARQGGQ
ncbi:homing endonuclease associated repeat-containing protein [Halorubellus salinus]|uniref:homing endonuclease associated repeat-containing protein n=1 Tax=Halorubellus salinus TaxID=755309 RepID=UPI001D089A9B|nr:hypothetical protein [Halorubellus salinus]